MILGVFLLGGVVTFAQNKPAKKEKTSCCSSSGKKSSKKSKCSSDAKKTEASKIDYTKVNETVEEVIKINKETDLYYNSPNDIVIQKVETPANKK